MQMLIVTFRDKTLATYNRLSQATTSFRLPTFILYDLSSTLKRYKRIVIQVLPWSKNLRTCHLGSELVNMFHQLFTICRT